MRKSNPIYSPYDKGRWYRFFIESDGNDHTLTQSDIEGAVISSSYLIIPADFHIVDFKLDPHTSGGTATTVVTTNYTRKRMGDGRQAFGLPSETAFDYAYAWAFGYFE